MKDLEEFSVDLNMCLSERDMLSLKGGTDDGDDPRDTPPPVID